MLTAKVIEAKLMIEEAKEGLIRFGTEEVQVDNLKVVPVMAPGVGGSWIVHYESVKKVVIRHSIAIRILNTRVDMTSNVGKALVGIIHLTSPPFLPFPRQNELPQQLPPKVCLQR